MNILKPERIVVAVPTLVPLGEPRPGTIGYAWSLAPIGSADAPRFWSVLHCAPHDVPDLITRSEAGPAKVTNDAHYS